MKEKDRIREILSYGIFGVMTTVVNIAVYQVLVSIFEIEYWISNLMALLASKIFAYVVNKKFVFHSKCKDTKALLKEIIRFVFARGATGLIDYFGLILAVEVFSFNRVYSKYALQAIVIILNFVLGKKAVFISGDSSQNPLESDNPPEK